MADTTEKEAKISIKVIVDKVKKRAVYAEADHTFVDILFSFMTLPMGTIARLLTKLDDKKFEALGSLKNLYQSLNDFPECYLATEECKNLLLNPRSLAHDHCSNLKLKLDDTEPMSYFKCMSVYCSSSGMLMQCNNVSGKDSSTAKFCRSCRFGMASTDGYLNSIVGDGGGVFVSDIATFIISDDLCVEPYSSAIAVRLLTDFGITDTNHLEEKILQMSSSQVIYFLKLALTIYCPFTYLLFSKVPQIRRLASVLQSSFGQCDPMEKDASATPNMLLEVSLQKSTGKVLFAESKEDFVEFLFCFLSIPLGTVIGTSMNGASGIRCMDNIFRSISNMSVGGCLKSQPIKEMLLKPHFGQQFSSKSQLFPLTGTTGITRPTGPKIYPQKDPRIAEKFLKQSGLLLVTNDLIVTPPSSFSTIDMLRKLEVRLDDIERHEVSIGLEEGIRMLKASLGSSSILTYGLQHHLTKGV